MSTVDPRFNLGAVRIVLIVTLNDGSRPKSGAAQHELAPMPALG